LNTNAKVQSGYIILLKGKKYVTFDLLLSAFASSDKHPSSYRSTLWRYLTVSKKIKSVKLGNMIVYLVDDIKSDVELIDRLGSPEILLKVILENEQ